VIGQLLCADLLVHNELLRQVAKCSAHVVLLIHDVDMAKAQSLATDLGGSGRVNVAEPLDAARRDE
jgi:hypothetical protein